MTPRHAKAQCEPACGLVDRTRTSTPRPTGNVPPLTTSCGPRNGARSDARTTRPGAVVSAASAALLGADRGAGGVEHATRRSAAAARSRAPPAVGREEHAACARRSDAQRIPRRRRRRGRSRRGTACRRSGRTTHLDRSRAPRSGGQGPRMAKSIESWLHARPDDVVPAAMPGVARDVDRLELLRRDLLAGGVAALVESSTNDEAAAAGGARDQVDDRLVGAISGEPASRRRAFFALCTFFMPLRTLSIPRDPFPIEIRSTRRFEDPDTRAARTTDSAPPRRQRPSSRPPGVTPGSPRDHEGPAGSFPCAGVRGVLLGPAGHRLRR